MNILARGAHPDDIEYGCGGTLIKYSRKGADVYMAILTEGGVGGDARVRKEEQEKSAKALNVKKVFWGGFEDTKLPANEDKIIKFIDGLIQSVKPDEIYINYWDDSHQDHRTLAQCGIAAVRYAKRVLFYEDYTSMNFEPDIFVDIEGVLSEKAALLKSHLSQVSRDYPTKLDILESVRAVANFRGFQGKVKYAEGFKALRFLKEIK
ncbi:MAG: PIG-L deacetylase family protein [Candidatus Omnitrophota bacterium]